MKSEKGTCLLLLLCGHALVGAELRGTTAEKRDHDRALQTASCSLFPACVTLFGGLNNVPPGAMCCPTPYGQTLSCCGTAPAPTPPDDTRTEVPAPTPTIPIPTPTTPVADASCLANLGCVELFGGADKVLPGSMCCPPLGTNANMACCTAPAPTAPEDTRTDVTAPTPTIPIVSAASCMLYPACVALGATDGMMCCPSPGTNQNMLCCGA